MATKLASATIGLLAAVALAGAAAAPPAAPATPAARTGLSEVVWELIAAAPADGSSFAPDDPSRYTVQFLPDGELGVGADCNRGRGSYSVDDGRLSITAIATTRMRCSEGSRGDDFVDWLGEVASFADDGEALVLTLRDNAGALRFRPALTGVVWEWRVLERSNDTTVTPDDPAHYTVEFATDGTVAVRADCNQGRGRYTADAPRIDVTAIATTKMGCPPGSLGDRFVRNLEEAVSFVFRDGQLVLALPVDAGFLRFVARAEHDEATPKAG